MKFLFFSLLAGNYTGRRTLMICLVVQDPVTSATPIDY
jgi:hypothetical protein